MADGKFITGAEVINRFGKDNLLRWLNLDNDEDATQVDQAFQSAIDEAEEEVQNTFQDGRYRVPFTIVTTKIKRWMIDLTGVYAYGNRGQDDEDADNAESGRMTNVEKHTRREMDYYSAGSRRLNIPLSEQTRATSPVVLSRQSALGAAVQRGSFPFRPEFKTFDGSEPGPAGSFLL